MSHDFVVDIEWRDPASSVTFAIHATTPGKACLLATYAPRNSTYGSYMLELEQKDDIWWPRVDEDGIAVYDITRTGPFVRLSAIPAIIMNRMEQIRDKLHDQGQMLADKGRQRERAGLADDIRECKARISAARSWIETTTARLETWVQTIDRDTRLIHVSPSAAPFALREPIDTELGPLVLDILGGDRFTLSTPKSLGRDNPPLARKRTWNNGVWSALQEDQGKAAALARIADKVLVDYRRDFKRASWAEIAMARHDLMIEEQVLDTLESKILPELETRLAAFDAPAETSPAPRG